MSTGILYHCFGITGRGIHYVHARFEQGRTIFRIGQDPTTLECPACGGRKVRKKGTVFRRFMTLPIGLRQTIIEFPIQRVLCLACGMIRQVKIGFADPDRRYTKRFERYSIGTVEAHDHDRCSSPSGDRLAHGQGDSEDVPPQTFLPAVLQRAQADSRR